MNSLLRNFILVLALLASAGAGFAADPFPTQPNFANVPDGWDVPTQPDVFGGETDPPDCQFPAGQRRVSPVPGIGGTVGIAGDSGFLGGFQVPARPGKGGFNEFNATTGSAHRRVTDLVLFAGVGEHRLNLTRFHNTVFINTSQHFGVGGNWRHSYQWELAGNGEDRVDVYYPNGAVRTFTPFEDSEWRGPALSADRLFKTNESYTLQTSLGWRYSFLLTNGNFVFQSFKDSAQNTYTITSDSSNRVTKVTEPAGRYVQINFTNALIASVAASDGRTVSYSYATYTNSSVTYDGLVTVTYPDSSAAQYQYWAAVPLRLATADDPRVAGPATRIRYDYYEGTSIVHKEINPVTSATLTELTATQIRQHKIIAPDGGTNILNYAVTGGIGSTVDALGNATSYGYDDNRFLAAVTNALGAVTLYTNNAFGSLLAMVYPDSSVEKWTLDDLGLVLTHTNVLGYTTTYTRDTNYRVARVDYPDGNYEGFGYNSFGQVTLHTNRNGGLDTFGYSTNGLLLKHTNALGYVTSYGYDSYDRLLVVTNALSQVTGLLYNDLGQILIITNADASLVKIGYDTYGNRTSQTNELGKVWTWGWNELRQMTNSADPIGRTTTYEYTIGGGCCGGGAASPQLTLLTLPGGQQTKFEYDAAGQRTVIIAAYGASAAATNTFAYDAAGNVTNRVDGRGKNWKSAFNSMNFLTSATDPLTNTTTWTYSSLGQKLTEVRPDGGTNKWLYDSMNRVTNTTDTLNQVTTFTYTALGKLNTLIDARTNTTGWGYDLLGRQTYKTYADGYGDYYAYDGVGNLILHTNASAQIHSFFYDARNRNTTNSWNTTNGATVFKAYDAAGRLTNLVHLGAQSGPAVTNTYTYSDAGQLLSELTQLSAITNQLTVSYAYNTNSQRSTLTYPDTSVASYVYTDRGQVKEINAEGQTPLASFTYDLNGNRLTKPLANGTTANYTYDDASRLTQLSNVKGATVIAQFDYNMDVVSRRTNRVEQLTSGGPTTDTYKYDGTDQVTNVVYAGATTVTYGYDPLGNLTNKNYAGNSTNYSANNLNQYTNIGGATPTYDSRGNMLTRPGWTNTWDAQNRLLSATGATNKMEFAYDGRNRCINRNTYVWTNSAWSLSYSSYLTYDGWSLIDERNGSGTLIARYVNGPMIDELVRRTTGSTTNYYHGDALNSTVALTDASGNAQERYRYDVFGMPAIYDAQLNPLSTSAVGNRTLFQGREWLAEVVLNDHRHRLYAPDIQRWLNRDPIGLAGGDGNTHRFVFNNPVLFNDPSGEVAWVIIGAIVGGGINLGVQLWSNGGNLSDVNWWSVGISAVQGGVGVGIAGSLAQSGASIGTQIAVNTVVGSAAAGAAQVENNAVNGVPLDQGLGGAMTWGAVTGGVGTAAGGMLNCIGRPTGSFGQWTLTQQVTQTGVLTGPGTLTAWGASAGDWTSIVISNLP